MRLIDADKITAKVIVRNMGVDYGFVACAIIDMLKNQPTAYNLNMVVEQLAELADKANDKILESGELQQYYDGYEDGVRAAIEIAKDGRANEKKV